MDTEKDTKILENKNTKLYKKFCTLKRSNKRLKNENTELRKKLEHFEKNSKISNEWVDLN